MNRAYIYAHGIVPLVEKYAL